MKKYIVWEFELDNGTFLEIKNQGGATYNVYWDDKLVDVFSHSGATDKDVEDWVTGNGYELKNTY